MKIFNKSLWFIFVTGVALSGLRFLSFTKIVYFAHLISIYWYLKVVFIEICENTSFPVDCRILNDWCFNFWHQYYKTAAKKSKVQYLYATLPSIPSIPSILSGDFLTAAKNRAFDRTNCQNSKLSIFFPNCQNFPFFCQKTTIHHKHNRYLASKRSNCQFN